MQLAGNYEGYDKLEKDCFRANQIEVYKRFMGFIPLDQFFVTMSADYSIVVSGKRIVDPNSTIARMIKEGVKPSQIIAIDWNQKKDKKGKVTRGNIHQHNEIANKNSYNGKIRNIEGEFFTVMFRLLNVEKLKIAMIDQDMMCTPVGAEFKYRQGALIEDLTTQGIETLLYLNVCVRMRGKRSKTEPTLPKTAIHYLMKEKRFRDAMKDDNCKKGVWEVVGAPIWHTKKNRYLSGIMEMEPNILHKTVNPNFSSKALTGRIESELLEVKMIEEKKAKKLARKQEKIALAKLKAKKRKDKAKARRKKINHYYEGLTQSEKNRFTRKLKTRKAKRSTIITDKSPKMIEAGKKAYATRLANQKKLANK